MFVEREQTFIYSDRVFRLVEQVFNDLIPGTWHQVPVTRYLVPGTWYLVPGNQVPEYPIPGTWYPVLATCYLLTGTRYP